MSSMILYQNKGGVEIKLWVILYQNLKICVCPCECACVCACVEGSLLILNV